MLNHQTDMDRMFDSTIKRSVPFLVYPNMDFRNRLADKIMAMTTAYRAHNFDEFPKRIDEIEDMLNSAQFDGILAKHIDAFSRLQMTLEDMYYQLDERVSQIEDRLNHTSPARALPATREVKRKRGRPRKYPVVEPVDVKIEPDFQKIEPNLICMEPVDVKIEPDFQKIELDYEPLDPSHSNTEIVYDCIVKCGPISRDDIISYTRLGTMPVKKALSNIKAGAKYKVKSDKQPRKRVKYYVDEKDNTADDSAANPPVP